VAVGYLSPVKTYRRYVAMKQKDIKKILTTTEGGKTMTKEEIKQFLVRGLGFVCLEESEGLKNFGVLTWQVYDYEAWIEPAKPKKPFETFYTEGMTLLMEIQKGGFYTHIYRVVRRYFYLIHIATGPYHKYFDIWVYDTRDLEQIAQIEVSEGYLFIGSQSDLEDVLPELIKALDAPVKIC
jgi:hypothetical protein